MVTLLRAGASGGRDGKGLCYIPSLPVRPSLRAPRVCCVFLIYMRFPPFFFRQFTYGNNAVARTAGGYLVFFLKLVAAPWFGGGDRLGLVSVLHEAAYVRLAVGGRHMEDVTSCRDVAHVKDGFRLRPQCHKPTEHRSTRQVVHLYVAHLLRCRDRQGVACGIGIYNHF